MCSDQWENFRIVTSRKDGKKKKKKKVSYKREHGPEKLKTPALSIVHFTKHELYFVLPK